MSFTTYYGPNTTVSETCLWIADGTRRICVTYDYCPSTGILRYAATVFRCDPCGSCGGVYEPTEDQMIANAHTTTRRYEIRPVVVQVMGGLGYDDIIKTIRHEMCHGYGCKGPRNLDHMFPPPPTHSYSESDCSSSNNSFLSDVGVDTNDIDQIDWDKVDRMPIRQLRYISKDTVENYGGLRLPVTREFFVTFKANKNTGDLIYGAAISRRPTETHEETPMSDDLVANHFKTATARLEKFPVHIKVSEDFWDQLRKNAPHREDVMYEILDRILERDHGQFVIRGM